MAIHISYQLSPHCYCLIILFSVIFFYLLCRVGLRDLFAVCSSNWPKTTVFFVWKIMIDKTSSRAPAAMKTRSSEKDGWTNI